MLCGCSSCSSGDAASELEQLIAKFPPDKPEPGEIGRVIIYATAGENYYTLPGWQAAEMAEKIK
jgi:hypothetical protein